MSNLIVPSKSPDDKKLIGVVLKSGRSSWREPSNVWTGISNGQEQSIPHSINSGGQFAWVKPKISCKTFLHTSIYEHEPIESPWTIVHLTGKDNPAIVLIKFIEPETLHVISRMNSPSPELNQDDELASKIKLRIKELILLF